MNFWDTMRFFETTTSKNIRLLLQKVDRIMTVLDQLTADVTSNTTVTQSAITLLQGLKNRLDLAIAANQAGDATQLAALSTSLEAQTAALAAAVTANTPVDPQPGTQDPSTAGQTAGS